jgi:hypothetical protein
VLLHVSQYCSPLAKLLEPLYEHKEMGLSEEYMLSWMRDMRVVHPVARWGWQLLGVLYKDHSLISNPKHTHSPKEDRSHVTQHVLLGEADFYTGPKSWPSEYGCAGVL